MKVQYKDRTFGFKATVIEDLSVAKLEQLKNNFNISKIKILGGK